MGVPARPPEAERPAVGLVLGALIRVASVANPNPSMTNVASRESATPSTPARPD